MELNDRQTLVMAEALAIAIAVLEKLPDDRQPTNTIRDMQELLGDVPDVYARVSQNVAAWLPWIGRPATKLAGKEQ